MGDARLNLFNLGGNKKNESLHVSDQISRRHGLYGRYEMKPLQSGRQQGEQ